MTVVPTDIEPEGEERLRILWSDGHQSTYTVAALRAACPCAPCREARRKGGRPQPAGAASRLDDVEPVGNYALSLAWGDGHRTGVYTFEYLRGLCECQACR